PKPACGRPAYRPAQALLTINKFFGVTGDGSGNGPIVDGDPESRRLWVRGTPQQVELVRQLIDELENDSLAGGLGDNVRILPLTESSARDTIDQLESLWPLMGRGTRLRIIGPSDGNNSNDSLRQQRDENSRGTQPNAPLNQPFRSPPVNDSVDVRAERLVQPQTLVWQLPEGAAEPMSSSSEVVPEIVIQVTPAGLIIASQDTAALDSLEQIITSLSDASLINSDVPTIFRLQYLKADVAAEMVAGVLGGADSGASASSLTDSVVSGLGGGMLGGLLGVGGGGDDDSGATSVLTSRGNVNIVPDNRLNSLIVQASPTDLEFIRVILKEIDQEESPIVVRTVAQPKLIPVIYQDAADVAKIVKEVFADKVQSDESNSRGGRGGGGGAPSPQDFFAALRGGRGGGGGGNTEKPKSEPVPLIVAVDERSNSLIVTSTPQDIQMVEELVAALDQSGLENEETVEVIPITGTMNPEVLRQALESVLGQTASSTGENSGGNSGASNGSGGSSSGSESSPSPDEIRRRIEAFRSRFGGGGGGSPFGGGGFGGGRGGPPGAASGGARGATGGRGGPTGGGRPGGGRGGR
ncbi:MAG: secretin N-terminal domain-containing protein, partial [Planctomycetota bacterium]